MKLLLVDIDDTIYPKSCGLLRELDRRIVEFIEEKTNLSEEKADVLRKELTKNFGTVFLGMGKKGFNPQELIEYTFKVDYEKYLKADSGLKRVLDSLNARKVVFTNATLGHTEKVLDCLGVAECFERIFALEDFKLEAKPYKKAFEKVLKEMNYSAKDTAIVDDFTWNLREAKKLGMQTILVDETGENGKPGYADFKIKNIKELSRIKL